MRREPVGREASDIFQCAGFFEQMRGAGHDVQAGCAVQALQRLLVKPHNVQIAPADNQQNRCLDARQRCGGQIRSAAAPVLAPK